MNENIGSSVKGKIGENIIIGEFLKWGFEVYLPVVDRGIDCVIRGSSGKFYTIQIKTRATEGKGRNYFYVHNFQPSTDFFIVLYSALTDETYVLPSEVFEKHSSEAYARRGTRRRLVLTDKKRRILSPYKDGYEQFK